MQRLAHQGEQDAWFTGNPAYSLVLPKDPPEETYLQKSFEVPFDNQVLFGGTAIATLPMYGERITGIALKMVLPQLEVPLNPNAWVYPTQRAVPPAFSVIFANGTYQQLHVRNIVQYFSTINLIWLPPANPYVTFGVTQTNFTFTYTDPTIVAIGFSVPEDAVFFGFDPASAAAVTSVGYVFAPGTISPLTFVQSGWISGYIPYPLPVTYVDSVGTFIVRTVQLLIGGQTIDTVTGEFLELQQDLEVPYENQAALTLLIGKKDTSPVRAPQTYYSKLPFTKEFSIPIRDLSRHDVQIAASFDIFYNIAPSTSQQKGYGFTNSDSLVFLNYITGDNSTGLPGLTLSEDAGGTMYSLALIVDSAIWDGQYVYMFTRVTILELNTEIPYFIVYDTHQNIVTQTSATSVTQFDDLVLNQCVTSIGNVMYGIGATGNVYSTTMNGLVPPTTLPTTLTQVPVSSPGTISTIATDGSNLYVTSTMNDAYLGPDYNNVYVYTTSTGLWSNIFPVPPTVNINLSVQPVFDGTNMWYVDKYQSSNVYTYNVNTGTWSFYDYTVGLGVPQLNIACSVFDGTSVYWFTDVTLTSSLVAGSPVNATTGNWFQYNTITHTWTAFNWFDLLWDPGMGTLGDPAISQAVFDGRYINFASYVTPLVFQYDTTMPFTSPSSYSWFNYGTGTSSLTTTRSFLLPNPYGYGNTLARIVFDGRFVIYLPYTSGTIDPTSNASIPAFILRYDAAAVINPPTFQASLIVKYDKLPDGTPLSNEYYVAQTSLSQAQVDTSIMKTASSGPVKELFIVNQNPTISLNPYNYTTQASTLRLAFNNESTGDYTTWVLEPFMYHTAMPQRNSSLVSFSFDPESPIPQGTVNFSRIREIQLTYPTQPGTYTRVYTRSYNILRVQNGLGGLLFNSPQWHDMTSIDGRWDINYVARFFIG